MIKNQKHIKKKFIISLGLLLGFCFAARAQDNPATRKAQEYYDRAMRALYQNNTKGVIENCENAIEQLPNWEKPYLMEANYLQDRHNDSFAVLIYNRLLAAVPDNWDGYMGRARSELRLEQYQAAKEDFKHATTINVPDKYHKAALAAVDRMKYVMYLVAHPVPFSPENLGPNVNSPEDEYFPTFTVDGETMYFTRRKLVGEKHVYGTRFNEYNEDIMMSHKGSDGTWAPAEDIPGPINTPDNNEGAMTIAPDGSFLIYTSCVRGNCDLYISFWIDDKWTKPVNMGEPVNSAYNEKQTTISADGRTIYFSSNRPGTMGGLDLWKSTRDDNWNFSEPVNLGPAINTKEDEQFPFIHPDNQTLYFISRGHQGMGEDDIFYARRNAAGDFDSAINIGYPINTPADEPGVVIDRLGEYAYFSSARPGGQGKLDLYRFKLPGNARPKPVTYLKAHVQDIDTKKPLAADLELIDLSTGKPFLKTAAGNSGDVEAVLPSGQDYMVNVSDSGYLFFSDNIPLKDYKSDVPYKYTIELKPIRAGEKISLKNVFFPSDGYVLEESSKAELQKLVAFMQANKNIKLEISGHTDNTGNAKHNQELSEKRAKAVYDYMVNDGHIPAARLSYKGYGDSQPVASNNTEEGKKQNRRTEVKILQ